MTSSNLVNIGAGNGVLPDNTKPLPEILIQCLRIMNGVLWHSAKTNFTELFEISIRKMSLKNTPANITTSSTRGQWLKLTVKDR